MQIRLRYLAFLGAMLVALMCSLAMGGEAFAHNILQHYRGRGAVLVDSSSIFTDARCDTGYRLPMSGGSISVGPCTFPVTDSTDFGGNFTFGNVHYNGNGIPTSDTNIYFVAVLSISSGTAEVATRTGVQTGKIDTTDKAYGVRIDVVCHAQDTTGTPIENDSAGPVIHHFCFAPFSGTVQETVNPCTGRTSAGTISGVGVCVANGFDLNVLRTNELDTVAQVTCGQNKHSETLADAQSASALPYNDLFVYSGGFLRHVSPSADVAQTYPLNTTNTPGIQMLSATLIYNEQKVFADGNYGEVFTRGLHIIVTDPNGLVVADWSINEAQAAEHCGKHLPKSDNLIV